MKKGLVFTSKKAEESDKEVGSRDLALKERDGALRRHLNEI